MNTRERQGWMIVVSLFMVMVIINGSGYGAQGVFFTPLLKQFGWTRAKLSLLQSTMGLTMGVAFPLAGLLLDRIEAKVVMLAGALLAGAAFAGASTAHSFGTMLAAYIAFGFGMGRRPRCRPRSWFPTGSRSGAVWRWELRWRERRSAAQ